MEKEFYQFKKQDAIDFARSRSIKFHDNGDEIRFQICPLCEGGRNHERETFSINAKTGQCNCKRVKCGYRGNMITLARAFDFSLGPEVDEYLKREKKYKLPYQGKPSPDRVVFDYLKSRHISEETAKKYNIGSKRGTSNILYIPFYDENEVAVFVKYRKTDFDKTKDKNKEWCEPGCKPILFGMNHCNFDNKTLVITEGQLDSLSLSEAGIENAVSVPNGAKGFTWIKNCWNFLCKFEELIVFGDYENGHISLLDELKGQFVGCVKHVRPEDYKGCKDANEILQKYGKGELRRAYDNAIPVKNPRIIRLVDVEKENLAEKEQFSSGVNWLDRKLGGFYFGQLAILTGERGEGKSTLASQFATFAVKAGYSVFIYSGEMNASQVGEWFELQAAGPGNIIKFEKDDRGTFYGVKKEIRSSVEKWYGDKVFIYNNRLIDSGLNETLTDTLKCAIQQYGCRVIIIDNLMSAISDDLSTDFYRQQSAFVRKVAALAKQFDAMIFLIAHPRKTGGDRITNDSISGSANITNLADIVLQYGRTKDDDLETRTLTVLKNRLTGKIDRDGIPMYFNEASKRISERETFEWALGWEEYEGFVNLPEDLDPPFN